MVTVHGLCLILALIFFALAAVEVHPPHGNLVGAGLFFLTVALLVPA
jgi:hypothetical protein